MHTGFVGCEGTDLLSLPDNHTEAELDEAVWDMALNHAQAYGTEPYPDDYEDGDEGEEYDLYSENIEGHAELYDPELHDQHRAGGGSFQDEIDHVEALNKLAKDTIRG